MLDSGEQRGQDLVSHLNSHYRLSYIDSLSSAVNILTVFKIDTYFDARPTLYVNNANSIVLKNEFVMAI